MLAFSVIERKKMNIFLWGVFYTITSIFLIYFFLREKKVIDFVRKKEDGILKGIELEEEGKEKRIRTGNILTVAGLATTAVFFFLVDKTPDPMIQIKNWGIYGIFAVNIVFLALREQHEWILMGNLVMMFLGRLMFNIMDNKFYIYLSINLILSVILIYLFRKPSKEEITEKTLIEEMKENKRNKNKKIVIENVEETIEVEKRRRSSIGKAFQRISTSVTAIVLVLVIQVFYLGNYLIPSGSMEETIKVKDRVFSNMVKYRFTTPKVNEIVAFKEPIINKVMYTKRLVGEPGQTLQIKDMKEMTLTDPSSYQIGNERLVEAGNIYLNDKKEEKLDRFYSKEGIMLDSKIYIPKKGDKVKLDKIIMMEKEIYTDGRDNFIGVVRWDNYAAGNYKPLTGEEFLNRIKVTSGFKDIIGNDDKTSETDPRYDVYYTFLLKVEGKNEVILPIMDLKYDDGEFLKLLKGESVTLKYDYYMAMGDNTVNSLDSRFFGYVSENRIKGELLVRWWPLNRIGLL